ncbi:MAG: EAL and HDOD domain-containing protein [Planctomycetaceae bacterium]
MASKTVLSGKPRLKVVPDQPRRSESDSGTLYVARQPIVRPDLQLEAYELLFRSSATACDLPEGHWATSQVLLNTFAEFGLDQVVGRHKAFVNLTREFLTGKYPVPERPDALVLEVLEDIPIDDELLAGIRLLRERGFGIAIDDVVFDPRLAPLLDLADYIKLELPAIPPDDLPRQVEAFRRWPAKLLAEKVESDEQFERCRSLGFDLFQGFFHARPEVLTGASQPINQAVVVQLLALNCRATTSVEELEVVIQQDPRLCYKFLRYVNSSVFGLRQITSIRHGLVLLGRNGTATMAAMLKLAGLGDVPGELIVRALIRGQMCSELGGRIGGHPAGDFCTVGVLSMLDALTGRRLEEIVEELRLADHLSAALLGFEGTLGQVLRSVLAYERGDWSHVDFPELSARAIRDAYLAALVRADELASALSASLA